MSNHEAASPALAQMIHQTDLFTWVVRTASQVLAILVFVPLVSGLVGALIDSDGGGPVIGTGVGVLASLLFLLGWLPSVRAPRPSEEVVALLEVGESG
ncbi:hypothetical protein [Nocardioides sp. GXZ039]|uniref:hypothetical protein n=1 Tax=Nocardioides sp. GXZ039 TaxID=3136018 RepID=UPI0030F371CC